MTTIKSVVFAAIAIFNPITVSAGEVFDCSREQFIKGFFANPYHLGYKDLGYKYAKICIRSDADIEENHNGIMQALYEITELMRHGQR